MSRFRVFVASIVAATGLLAVGMQSAGAVIINGQIGEAGSTPSTPPASGQLVHLCITIRPNPTAHCIDI